MDIWDKEKRSAVMARIRSKDTKPELIVRRYLYHRGYRYRKNVKGLPGTPDIVLRKYGVIIGRRKSGGTKSATAKTRRLWCGWAGR